MLDPVIGIVFFSLSGIIALVLRELDKLVATIDTGSVSTRDLGAMETRVIEWIFVPLVVTLSAVTTPLPTRDVDAIKMRYNYNVAQVEVARNAIKEYDHARLNLRRSLVAGALVLIPPGALVVSSAAGREVLAVDQAWVTLVVVVGISLFVGCLFVGAYAWSFVRRSRRQYRNAVDTLQKNLSSQPTSGLGTAREEDRGYA